MTQSAAVPLLRLVGLTKRFPGVAALTDVEMEVGAGEVLAVIGENGAGKSTLMKILAGVQRPDAGEIQVDGRPVEFHSVADSLAAGVVLIHQELNLADNLDVGANIFLGREPQRFGFVDRAAIERESQRLLKEVNLNVSPRRIVGGLSIGQRQLIEIAKALSADARVIIFDEPTSSLSHGETLTLFEVIRALKARGVSVVYISHRLGEVRELADRVVALRDGRNAGGLAKSEIDEDRMVSLMVGRAASAWYHRKPTTPGDVTLEVQGLVTQAHPNHRASFSLRKGEIVGVAGLVGAGRTELLEALFGVTPALEGTIKVDGRSVAIDSPYDAIKAGLALVPEDRKLQGLVLEMSVRENISLASLWRNRLPGGFRNASREKSDAVEMIRELRIKTSSPTKAVQLLSGGNQQKVVIARWLELTPPILLLDEPTRGVDVGAKEEIYRLMEQIAAKGAAVLFVSSELQEILALSDRALVMHEGRITADIPRAGLSEEAVMKAATGQVSGRKLAAAGV
ncbi:MAG TPA: sugar ABC transporter ATP-binding protein [Pirellulales bacterium]